MVRTSFHPFLLLIICVSFLCIDQITKYWICSYFGFNFLNNQLFDDLTSIPYTSIYSFFNLVLVGNNGVSFSLFSSDDISRVYILASMSVVIIGLLIYFLIQEKSKFIQMAYCFMIGGALGNVIDRLRLQKVVDFIDIHYMGFHWPAFNFADVFICLGVGFFVISIILNKS